MKWLESVRRPGRFSVRRYPRPKALARAAAAGRGMLDIGAGNRRITTDAITLDLAPGPCIDVVADALTLPFGSGTFEGIWLEAVLEHVADPYRLLDECRRVLRDGGWLYCEVPFLQGEHAAPTDYRRWTRQGLEQVFDEWDIEWLEPASGPFSALAYQLRVCLAAVTSFGSRRLYGLLLGTIWAYVVWPIKFLDVFVRTHKFAIGYSFGWALMARKHLAEDSLAYSGKQEETPS